jgi:hypothetical protein
MHWRSGCGVVIDSVVHTAVSIRFAGKVYVLFAIAVA